ncbi:hypothetical protein ACIQVU_07895 [Lysinibacillus sp. NPDC098008]|uniref:hypothetical protein n=1 Tax=Lysinibacillus sp. NPDC098008 TaxID=3364146 RepID=UPI00382316CB
MLNLKIEDKKYLLKVELAPEVTGDEVLIKDRVWGSFAALYKKQIETGYGILEYRYMVYISRLNKTANLVDLEDLISLDFSEYKTYSKETLNELFEEVFYTPSLEKEYKKLVKDTVRFSKHIEIDKHLAEQIAEELAGEQVCDYEESSHSYKINLDLGEWLIYENNFEEDTPSIDMSRLRNYWLMEQIRRRELAELQEYYKTNFPYSNGGFLLD